MRSIAGSVVGQHISNDNAALGEPVVAPPPARPQPSVRVRLSAFPRRRAARPRPPPRAAHHRRPPPAPHFPVTPPLSSAPAFSPPIVPPPFRPPPPAPISPRFSISTRTSSPPPRRFHPAHDSPRRAVPPAAFRPPVARPLAAPRGAVAPRARPLLAGLGPRPLRTWQILLPAEAASGPAPPSAVASRLYPGASTAYAVSTASGSDSR